MTVRFDLPVGKRNRVRYIFSESRYLSPVDVQDYGKLAYMFDQPRDFREKILTMELGKDHLKYLISFIDLLATCAEVRENKTAVVRAQTEAEAATLR